MILSLSSITSRFALHTHFGSPTNDVLRQHAGEKAGRRHPSRRRRIKQQPQNDVVQGPARASPEVPEMRFPQHQILLLQQLQPNAAPTFLQDLQTLLDQRRSLTQRPHRRRLPEKQESKIVFVQTLLQPRLERLRRLGLRPHGSQVLPRHFARNGFSARRPLLA